MSKTVAIHQPNFFPWLGYFDKIARSDAFIFLDDVQLQRSGGSWTNRVKLLISGKAHWVTAAIDRKHHGTLTIRESSFLADTQWRAKLLRSIEVEYRRCPFYAETMDMIALLLLNPEVNIAEYNIQAITAIVHRLGLDTDKLKCSSVIPYEGSSNELLCSLTQLAGGDTYMCGGGAESYQDEDVFTERGIELSYQSFAHPIYPQRGREDFVAGLSIIDAAMNLGWTGVAQLLNKNRC
jgi:hypothetical protein